MKATEQFFPVVLFVTLYKVVLTSVFVDEILKCDHSNESCWAVLFCGIFYYYAVQGGSKFWARGKSQSVTIRIKAIEKYFPVVLFIIRFNDFNFWIYKIVAVKFLTSQK